jgi:hypothetical protein
MDRALKQARGQWRRPILCRHAETKHKLLRDHVLHALCQVLVFGHNHYVIAIQRKFACLIYDPVEQSRIVYVSGDRENRPS